MNNNPQVMEDLRALDSTEKEGIRKIALTSNYFMGKAILGYTKFVPHVHRPMSDFFCAPPARDIIHLAPRDHFKTTCDTIVDTCRLLADDPNTCILIRNEVEENAEAMLRGIKNHFVNNQKFRWLFPEIIPQRFKKDSTWSHQQIVIPRTAPWTEPSVRAVGITTAVVSSHYDVLKFDDMVGMKAMESPTLMAKAKRELQYSISLLREPEKSRRHISGTRWRHDDPYGYAIDTMGFVPFIQKAIVLGPTGKPEPLFPELISLETLLEIMRQDPHQYATHYANDPFDASDMSFEAGWLQYYTVAPDGDIRFVDPSTKQLRKVAISDMWIYTHVDPALGNRKYEQKGDFYADITVGCVPGPFVFVLDYLKKRIQPPEQVERIMQIDDAFHPESVSIEHVGYQKALRFFAEDEMRRRHKYIKFEDAKVPTTKTKKRRIKGRLQPYFSNQCIFIRQDMFQFVEDYLKFDHTEDDHLLDVLAQGPEFWRFPLDPDAARRVIKAHEAQQKMLGGVTGYGV